MKNMFFLILFFLNPLLGIAQTASLDQFYEKYKEAHTPTLLKHDDWIEQLAECLIPRDEWNAWGQDTERMKVLVLDKDEVPANEWKQLGKDVVGDGFELLIQVRDQGDEAVQVMIHGDQTEVNNVLFLVEEDRAKVLYSLQGTWNLNDLLQNCDFHH